MQHSPCSNRFIPFVSYYLALLFFTSLSISAGQVDTDLPAADQLLEAGELSAARQKYQAATVSSDRNTRLAGLIGLGRVFRQIPGRRMQSLNQLRQAQKMEPGNPDILYEIALTGLELDQNSGISIADDALTEIICQDPDYRDAYALWHDRIKGRSMGNMERVAECLPPHFGRKPALEPLWLDIAYDWFSIFRTDQCLAALDSLLSVAPEFMPQERLLLRARCLLAMDDERAFEDYYNLALSAAENQADFGRLITEAELIFTPKEDSLLGSLKTAEQVSAFFRMFWRNKDPDPTTPVNERLIEHYHRLRYAELHYRMLVPDGYINNSENYLRMMSRTTEFPNKIEDAVYEYDPARVFGRYGARMQLDHRGLLYVRHGAPDGMERIYIKDRRDGFVENLGKGGKYLDIPNSDLWRYGNHTMIFKSGLGTGGYVYFPSKLSTTADIERAMQTQTYNDPLPEVPPDYYSATFMNGDGDMELEFYQSVPVRESKVTEPPEARMVLYDTSLNELARDSRTTVSTVSLEDSIWLAVTSVPVEDLNYAFALSMDLPEVRTAVKKTSRLESIDKTNLATSDILLGVGATGEPGAYRRGGVELMPRPSLEFSIDEMMEALMEIYRLSPGSDGSLRYQVRATIKLIEQDRSKIGKLLEKFRLMGQERGVELTMQFERAPKKVGPVVVESFSIDTRELIPGEYKLVVVIEDGNGGALAGAQRNFRLVD